MMALVEGMAHRLPDSILCRWPLARVDWDSKDFRLGPPISLPGGSFRIPKLLTVGPELLLQGRVKARVTLGDLEIRQMYP